MKLIKQRFRIAIVTGIIEIKGTHCQKNSQPVIFKNIFGIVIHRTQVFSKIRGRYRQLFNQSLKPFPFIFQGN